MLYEIGSGGMAPIKTEGKNDLQKGTVLLLTGTYRTEYVIIKNLGIKEGFESYGAKYISVSLEDYSQKTHSASDLKWIEERTDNRIQTYIMGEVKTEEEILEIWVKSEWVRKETEAAKKYEAKVKADNVERGRELFAKHIPEDAKALIIAERIQDTSESQSDYFGHTVKETVILGHSKHTRDLFAEMRKHAAKIPETAHLEKDRFRIKPVAGKEFTENGRYHGKGFFSPWHTDETPREFNSEEEAQEFTNANPLHDITFEGISVPFEWDISKVETEHREKYSMGGGYYLKARFVHSSGWAIRKQGKYAEWREELYISMGKRCIF